MVRGREDIISWYEHTGMPYWRIYPHKGISSGNIVLQSAQEENQSKGDALQELKLKLRALHRGTYTIAAFPEPNKLPAKGYHWVDIEVTQSEAHQPVIAGPVGITPEEVQQRIDAAIIGYQQKVELDSLREKVKTLEKENKELQETANAPLNKFLGAIAPHSDKIIAGIFPQTRAVAGLPEPDPGPVDNAIADGGTDLTPEQSEVISEFISELSGADADWLNTLRRLTKKIKEQPGMIGMVKTFI